MKYLTNSSRIKTQSIFFSKQRWHSERYQWGLTVWKRKAYFKRAHSAVDNWTVWQKKTRENRPEVLHIFYQCSGNITSSSITSEEGFFFFLSIAGIIIYFLYLKRTFYFWTEVSENRKKCNWRTWQVLIERITGKTSL